MKDIPVLPVVLFAVLYFLFRCEIVTNTEFFSNFVKGTVSEDIGNRLVTKMEEVKNFKVVSSLFMKMAEADISRSQAHD